MYISMYSYYVYRSFEPVSKLYDLNSNSNVFKYCYLKNVFIQIKTYTYCMLIYGKNTRNCFKGSLILYSK